MNNLSHKKNDNNSINNLIRSSNSNNNSYNDDNNDMVNLRYDTEEHIFNEQSIVFTQNNEGNISPKKGMSYKNNFIESSNRPFSSILNVSDSNKVPPPSTKNKATTSIATNNEYVGLIKENNTNTKTNESTKSNIQFIYNSVNYYSNSLK